MNFETLKQLIEENITVYTKTENSQYNYYFKSPLIEEKEMKKIKIDGFKIANKFLKDKKGKTEWFKIDTKEGILIFRSVNDGKRDNQNEDIIRIEGSILPSNIIYNKDILTLALFLLEENLEKTKKASNNYSYDFESLYSFISAVNMNSRQAYCKKY